MCAWLHSPSKRYATKPGDLCINLCLKTPEQIAFYLNNVAASGDLDLMKEAMKNVLRANGFAKTVEKAGMSREGAYKALRPSSKPQFDTMAKLADSLGLELRFVPKGAHDNSNALAA